MKKINYLYRGFFAIMIVALMSACNKYSDSDLEGTWVYESETLETDEDGDAFSLLEKQQYEFKGGKMVYTLSYSADDVELYTLTVDGTYKYEEPSGGFEDSKAVGIIEREFNLNTIHGDYNSDAYNDEEQEALEATLEENLRSQNAETLYAQNSDVSAKRYYGLMVLSIDKNEMTIDGKNSIMTFRKE